MINKIQPLRSQRTLREKIMARNFDLLAPFYRLMEAVLAGSLAQKARLAWIDSIPDEGKILILGEGPGRFLEVLVHRFPQREITCIDLSPSMLGIAARSLPSQHRVEFQVADIATWTPPPNTYSVLVSHFFWDCFPPESLTQLIPRFADSLKSGGIWLITDFSIPSQGSLRWRAQIIHRIMYLFFRCVTGITASQVTPLDSYLETAHLTLAQRKTFSGGLLQADLWQK